MDVLLVMIILTVTNQKSVEFITTSIIEMRRDFVTSKQLTRNQTRIHHKLHRIMNHTTKQIENGGWLTMLNIENLINYDAYLDEFDGEGDVKGGGSTNELTGQK